MDGTSIIKRLERIYVKKQLESWQMSFDLRRFT